MDLTAHLPDLGAALAAGLLIGTERGWTLRSAAEGARVAGIRTFGLLGLVAGLAGFLAVLDHAVPAALLVAGPVAIVVIGYFRGSRSASGPDATSAVAAMVALALGFLAGSGAPALAIAGAAVTTLLLALRSETHGLIDRLDQADIMALARYAVIALAIYPFLPEGRYGPYDAWEPRMLWLVVVLVTGFSFLGYIANRLFGARRGTIATAVIGGIYSSTAVTQSLSQRLGRGEGSAAENAGIALATAVMYLRVLVLVGVLAGRLFLPFTVLLIPAVLTGLVASYLIFRQSPASIGPSPPGNPIAMLPALSFAAFVAVAAVAARWAEGQFGEQGIAILLLVMGVMDVDAAIVTAGGLGPDTITARLAALAIAGTIFANMSVKLGVTLAYGRSHARPAALALVASMIVLLVSIAIGVARL
ncbi:MAG: MgtC/SapB family protein [Sphingomonadaceae bacterium]